MQKNDENYKERATYPDVDLARHLFGEHNDNLKRIAAALDIKIHARGNTVHVQGDPIVSTLGQEDSGSVVSVAEGRLSDL